MTRFAKRDAEIFGAAEGDAEKILGAGREGYASRSSAAEGDPSRINLLSTAQAAIWAREEKSSLARMLVTWVATVRSPTTSSSAMARLDRPRAIRAATSRSRAVSPPKARLAACSGVGWRGAGNSAAVVAKKWARAASTPSSGIGP